MRWRVKCPPEREPRYLVQGVGNLTCDRLHTLSADELYAAHLTPFLREATEDLSSRLHSTQQENAAILSNINDQRAEIERLLNGLEWVAKDIEGSVGAMHTDNGGGVAELKHEVWQMEQEAAATR